MTSSIGIVATFIILGSILLFNLIYTSIHWLVKFLCITVTIYFSLVTFLSLEDLKGWPIETILPRTFMVLAVNINEPVSQEDKGGIYLWCRDMTQNSIEENDYIFKTLKPFFDLKKNANKPRSYEFKYSRKLHEKLSEVEDLIRKGKMIVGENKGKQGDKKSKEATDKMLGDDKGHSEREFEYELKFYELPPPKLPEKVIK